jgi:hypothetical protein
MKGVFYPVVVIPSPVSNKSKFPVPYSKKEAQGISKIQFHNISLEIDFL